jgi:hypothetical protein
MGIEARTNRPEMFHEQFVSFPLPMSEADD